jgi:hypothetical protein
MKTLQFDFKGSLWNLIKEQQREDEMLYEVNIYDKNSQDYLGTDYDLNKTFYYLTKLAKEYEEFVSINFIFGDHPDMDSFIYSFTLMTFGSSRTVALKRGLGTFNVVQLNEGGIE